MSFLTRADRSESSPASAEAFRKPAQPCGSGVEPKQEQPRDRRIAELEADLHSLSHSIRSPLVALKGFTGLLEDEAREQLGENGRHFLGRISEAGQRIEWRLSDVGVLLSISESPITPTWIDLDHVLEDLLADLKSIFEAKGAALIRPSDTEMIWCERSQLRMALLHMVGNALQHAASDVHPTIRVEVRRDEETTEILVIDYGPGIEAGLIPRAFELFTCAGNRCREFEQGRESTGLGLALVRRIAEAHGGSARIESNLGEGVRVILALPHPRE
jgi:signal transduction histidine kinase